MHDTDTIGSAEMEPASPMATMPPQPHDVFHRVEQLAYIAVGVMLAGSAAIALAGAVALIWHGAIDWTGTGEVFEVVDRLLFVLMLVEILHTVSASVRTGTLTVQPFLIVGLIASIRRVLMITLETSQTLRENKQWDDTARQRFNASLMELGVLAGLILVMVFSIYLLHRMGGSRKRKQPE